MLVLVIVVVTVVLGVVVAAKVIVVTKLTVVRAGVGRKVEVASRVVVEVTVEV